MTRAQKIKYAITHAGMKGHSSAEKIWDYNYNVTTPISGALYTAAGALGGSAEDIAKTFSKLKQRKRRKKMNEEVLLEKNVPTNPKLWAQAKAQAKKKFSVYPSAYANGWAAKKYKEMGGTWRTANESKEYDEGEYDQEGDMAKTQLRSIIHDAKELHDMLEDNENLPEWVQSKITLAQDYISTVHDYMGSKQEESVDLKVGDKVHAGYRYKGGMGFKEIGRAHV